jgi:hypothetical protein
VEEVGVRLEALAPNPFAKAVASYRDPTSGRTYEIPPDHTLYRDPRTRQLRVVPTASIK